MKFAKVQDSVLLFLYSPKREVVKSLALGITTSALAAYSFESFSSTLFFGFTGFLTQHFQFVRTKTWKNFLNEFIPSAEPEHKTFSWKHLGLATGLLPLLYLRDPNILDTTKESIHALENVVSTYVLPSKNELQSIIQTGLKLILSGKIFHMYIQQGSFLNSKSMLEIIKHPRTSTLSVLHPSLKKRKEYMKKMTAFDSLNSLNYFAHSLKSSEGADASAFLVENYFWKDAKLPSFHYSMRYKMAMAYHWRKTPLLHQTIMSTLFKLDSNYTNYLFDKTLLEAKESGDLDTLSLLALCKEKQDSLAAKLFWKELALETLRQEDSLDKKLFGGGTTGVYVPQQKGKKKDALRLVIGIKSNTPKKLLEEIAINDILVKNIPDDPSLQFPSYPHTWYDEQTKQQYAFIVLKHLRHIGEVAKANPKYVKEIYLHALRQVPKLGAAMKNQNEIDIKPINYEEKLLVDLLLDDKNIYDSGLVRERIARIKEKGKVYEQTIFDHHHNNILVPELKKGIFVPDEFYQFIIDNENKGSGTIMIDLVNLYHHRHDFFSPEEFNDIDLSAQLLFASWTNQDIQEIINLEASVLAYRQDAFMKAWSKPQRHTDVKRRAGFLEHDIQSFSHYKTFLLGDDKQYIEAEIQQTERLLKALPALTARWGK